MFCYQCGKEIPEGAAFCPGCGASANGQAAAPVATAEVKPSAAKSMLNSFLAVLKGVFSKDIVKTVGAQAKNTGNEWIIGIALSVLTFALATSVNILEGFSALIGSLTKGITQGMGVMGAASQAKDAIMEMFSFPFFSFFGVSLAIGVVVVGAVVAGIWLLSKVVAKKNVSWICVLNLVATATLPLSACYIANMLLGLIWIPLAMIVTVTALIMTMVLLYAGFQKLEKPVASPFYPYTVFTALVVIVAGVISYLLFGAAINGWMQGLAGNAMGMLGSMFG